MQEDDPTPTVVYRDGVPGYVTATRFVPVIAGGATDDTDDNQDDTEDDIEDDTPDTEDDTTDDTDDDTQGDTRQPRQRNSDVYRDARDKLDRAARAGDTIPPDEAARLRDLMAKANREARNYRLDKRKAEQERDDLKRQHESEMERQLREREEEGVNKGAAPWKSRAARAELSSQLREAGANVDGDGLTELVDLGLAKVELDKLGPDDDLAELFEPVVDGLKTRWTRLFEPAPAGEPERKAKRRTGSADAGDKPPSKTPKTSAASLASQLTRSR